jgi:hypothetical protein
MMACVLKSAQSERAALVFELLADPFERKVGLGKDPDRDSLAFTDQAQEQMRRID